LAFIPSSTPFFLRLSSTDKFRELLRDARHLHAEEGVQNLELSCSVVGLFESIHHRLEGHDELAQKVVGH